MRRLRDLQEVDLHLGARRFSERVLMVHESSAILTGDAHARLHADRLPATLSFRHSGALVSIEGRVSPGPLPTTTRFDAFGNGHLRDQRSRPRLRVRLPARVEFPGREGATAVEGWLRDISEHGVGLDGVRASPGEDIVVHIAQDGGTLTLSARVVRTTPGGCGAHITESPPRLGEAIVGALLQRGRS